jgi:hypothetical protein
MRGGALDAESVAVLRRYIALVKELMIQDNRFDTDVKQFFGNQNAYVQRVDFFRDERFLRRMSPWMTRTIPLTRDQNRKLSDLVITIRGLGIFEQDVLEIVSILNEESLINNEDIDTLLQSVHTHFQT